jgi:hypothetical protein
LSIPFCNLAEAASCGCGDRARGGEKELPEQKKLFLQNEPRWKTANPLNLKGNRKI